MAQLTLVLGGVRSGKSRFAEQLASGHPPVIYLATTSLGCSAETEGVADPEMVWRIAGHRQRREEQFPGWKTVEEGWDVPESLRAQDGGGCILVECLTLWVTNLLLGSADRPGLSDEEVRARVRDLVVAGQSVTAWVIVVSNEVGCGIIPASTLARRFGDLLGEANQLIAAGAENVHGCWAGIPVQLKPR